MGKGKRRAEQQRAKQKRASHRPPPDAQVLTVNSPNLRGLRLADFALAEDFWVRTVQTQSFGLQVVMGSNSAGVHLGFPWWDRVENDAALRQGIYPRGSYDAPFHDLEQSWRMVIFEHDGFVHVLQNDGGQEFTSYFKVRAEQYHQAWQGLIAALP